MLVKCWWNWLQLVAASLGLPPPHHHHLVSPLHQLQQADPFQSAAHLSDYSSRFADLSDSVGEQQHLSSSHYDSAGLSDLNLHHGTDPHRAGQYTPSPSDDSHCESPSHTRGDTLDLLNSSYLTPSYHLPLQVPPQQTRLCNVKTLSAPSAQASKFANSSSSSTGSSRSEVSLTPPSSRTHQNKKEVSMRGLNNNIKNESRSMTIFQTNNPRPMQFTSEQVFMTYEPFIKLLLRHLIVKSLVKVDFTRRFLLLFCIESLA